MYTITIVKILYKFIQLFHKQDRCQVPKPEKQLLNYSINSGKNLPKFLVSQCFNPEDYIIGWVLPFSLAIPEMCSLVAEQSKNHTFFVKRKVLNSSIVREDSPGQPTKYQQSHCFHPLFIASISSNFDNSFKFIRRKEE